MLSHLHRVGPCCKSQYSEVSDIQLQLRRLEHEREDRERERQQQLELKKLGLEQEREEQYELRKLEMEQVPLPNLLILTHPVHLPSGWKPRLSWCPSSLSSMYRRF